MALASIQNGSLPPALQCELLITVLFPVLTSIATKVLKYNEHDFVVRICLESGDQTIGASPDPRFLHLESVRASIKTILSLTAAAIH
jgi:hypothetical protein